MNSKNLAISVALLSALAIVVAVLAFPGKSPDAERMDQGTEQLKRDLCNANPSAEMCQSPSPK
jgi:hypothetical protein